MSRRREAADLQKALRLSTQGSIPHSSDILTSSSPIQIPSGFRLAFQSESTQDSTSLHPSSHSGSGGGGPPNTFQGFQGGIFAGLQTPVIGSDRSTGVLSPTMITIAHTSTKPGVTTNASSLRNDPRANVDEDEDVVPGSEDEETEEEQPFEAIRRSAENRNPGHALPASKPMSPMPIPPSETIGSFPTPSSSRHVPPRIPNGSTGQAISDVSSPIDGFTTSNSDGTDRRNGSSSASRPKDPSSSSIMLSKPTEIVRSRPAPKQRKQADGDVQESGPVNASEGFLLSGGARASSSKGGSGTGVATMAAEDTVAGGSESRARSITPPLKSKTTVVYTKRSINSKKRKILLSDSESEEDETVPPTIDQRILSASVSTGPSQSTKTLPEQSLADAERPSKKNRKEAQDSDRHARDSSIDPLDLDHVDPLRTPLKNRVIVEIDSANKFESTSVDAEHEEDDIVVVVPSASKIKSMVKTKVKRAQYDDDDDDDPFEGLPLDAAMGDSEEEDDFVPSSRKSKAAAKKKKAPPKKEKKPPKGKKAASATVPVGPTPAASVQNEAMEVDAMPNAGAAPGKAAEGIDTPHAKEAAQLTKADKGKAVTLTQSSVDGSTVSLKSTKYTEGEDEAELTASASLPTSTSTSTNKGKGEAKIIQPKAKAGKDNNKIKSKARVLMSDNEDEMRTDGPAPSECTPNESVAPDAGPVLQVTSESQLNVITKDDQVKTKSPNFVVGKGGKIVEFRTSRDDLPKVVSNTGGVKRMGMSRSFRIPSLHRNLKAPPKRLAAPPKKPERKKKSDDEYSDEEPLDEFGRPQPKPGSKEWYMMED